MLPTMRLGDADWPIDVAGLSMSGLRVLIVEDEPVIAEFLSDVLTGMGHEVCAVARTEDEAVSASWRTLPGLMIIDLKLAIGKGSNAARRVLQQRFVPHVFISGERAMLSLLGNAVTIRKPFSERDLARAIAASRYGVAGSVRAPRIGVAKSMSRSEAAAR